MLEEGGCQVTSCARLHDGQHRRCSAAFWPDPPLAAAAFLTYFLVAALLHAGLPASCLASRACRGAYGCAPSAQVQSLKKYAKTYELDVSNLGSKEELVSAIQRHWAQQAC